jgi:hypothetical protein
LDLGFSNRQSIYLAQKEPFSYDAVHSPLRVFLPHVFMDTAKKSGASSAKMLTVVIVLALVVLVLTIDAKRREAQKQLQQMTMKLEQLTGNPEQNAAEAKRIIDEVRAVYALPDDVEPTVATIVNVEELRKVNAFYNKAENGDHLIVTADRAILYDPDKKIVVDVVPVQIQPAPAADNATQQPAGQQAPVTAQP